MTTAAALATATPATIDTALAAIYTRLYANWDKQAVNEKHLVDMEQGLAKAASGNPQYSAYTQDALDRLVEKADALSVEAMHIQAETAPFDAEFTRRGGWSRFFLVANNGGHIHSSRGCSTCFPTTRFGWLPEISGLTEAEAVAKHGAILCTICYPSAPTSWTDRHDDSVCAGSGQYMNRDLPHRGPHFYSGNWATCETCGEQVTVVKSGKIRKHKK
jgi:hypothetical protein